MTVAFPLSAGSILIELSFCSLLIAFHCCLVMLEFGVLACLRHHLTLDLKSCASLSSMVLDTASVLAMISLCGMVLGAIEKLVQKTKPLLQLYPIFY